MKNKLFPVLSLLLFAGGCAAVGPDASWSTDYAAALAQAGKSGRPALVDFTGSDWCPGCIKLDEEVFSQPAFKAYARDNLVLLMLDFPRNKPQSDAVAKQNAWLTEKYATEGLIPTVLLLDASGRELARTTYRPGGAEAYVAHLKELLQRAAPAAAAKPNP